MRTSIFYLVSLAVLSFTGCFSAPPPATRVPDPPRREFESVEIADDAAREPFVVNEFVSDNNSFTKESVYFSTALFLSDAGILDETTKESFQKYAETIFSQFPDNEQVKEVVIPNFSKSEEEDVEKNAYLFVTKLQNKDGVDYYCIESNIGIASIWDKTYDGYVMRMDSGFHKNKIPASWTSIMYIALNNDILLYRGEAYPSKAAPLIDSGTGIASDTRMKSIMVDKSSLSGTKNKLQEAVAAALKNNKTGSKEESDSLKFLEKDSNMSFAAYSYIDSKFEDAKKYYDLAQKSNAEIPDHAVGSRYTELEKIMNYLINTIGK